MVLGGYTVLEPIGAGGMGRVFKALHRRMGRTVALKVLPPESVSSPEALLRFRREMKAAAQLTHPNIVTAYDAGQHGGIHYLVMEYVPGPDLGQPVGERGPLPVDEAVGYVVQAARGLAHAHAHGVVHRDVKPGNLLLGPDGVVKVFDLGLARLLTTSGEGEEGLTQTGAVLGTPDYMAPEQATDARRADGRADIYSLGCTLYFLLTGKPVYGGQTVLQKVQAHQRCPLPSLRNSRPEVPDWLDAAFRRMVAKEPEARYQSMGEVIEALSQARRPGRRSQRLWLGGSLAAALLMVAGVALFSGGLIQGPVGGLGTVVVGAGQPDTQVVVDAKTSPTGSRAVTTPLDQGGEPAPEKNVKRPGSNRSAPGPEQVGGRWAELAASGNGG